MLADDHVCRLDVAMEHAPAVGVLDGVANVDEPPQQVAQLERAAAVVAPKRRVGVESLDCLLEAFSPYEPHRVVRPLAVVSSQAVDRDDARVLQPAGDFRLEHEATAAVRVVGVAWEDLLEGDLAVELGVEGDEDGTQPAAGVRPEDAEPLAIGSGRAHGNAAGSLGVVVDVGFCLDGRADHAPRDPCERGLDVELAECGQAGAGGSVRRDRGQAFLDVAAVPFQMGIGEHLERRTPGTGQVAAGFQMIGEALRLVERPGLEGGQELALVDETILKSEQSEEKMAVGGGGHGEVPGVDVAARIPDQMHDHGAPRAGSFVAFRIVRERRPGARGASHGSIIAYSERPRHPAGLLMSLRRIGRIL